MPILRAADPPLVFLLPAGDLVTVVAPSGSSARFVHLANQVPDTTVSGATSVFGPYGTARRMSLNCTAGAVNYAQKSSAPAQVVVSPAAPVDADSYPDGTVWIQTT